MHMLHTYNQRSLCHTQAYTLIHALTLFTLPRYSSPSLHRANTSSPSLTPPILRKETERGERAGLMWNGNPIYSLNTLLPLLTEGFMAPAFRLLLRQAGFSAKGLKSPPLHPPPFRLEHSDSLYPPQWKMRVSTQPESKTNDYCTHQIHIHTQKKNTAWWLLQYSLTEWAKITVQLLETSSLHFAVVFPSPNILKTWIDASNDSAGIISAHWAFVPVHALKSRQTQDALQCM